jgi:hypothetical protein
MGSIDEHYNIIPRRAGTPGAWTWATPSAACSTSCPRLPRLWRSVADHRRCADPSLSRPSSPTSVARSPEPPGPAHPRPLPHVAAASRSSRRRCRRPSRLRSPAPWARSRLQPPRQRLTRPRGDRDGHAHFAPFDRGPAESHTGVGRRRPPCPPSRPPAPRPFVFPIRSLRGS